MPWAPARGAPLIEEEISIHCELHLGKLKTPKVIKFMEDLPKGPSGKIQRLDLKEAMKE